MASDQEADRVTRLIETYHELFSAGDLEGVLNLWDDDGSVFEPGSPTARGKTQLRIAYERGYAAADYRFECKVAEVVIGGSIASVLSRAAGSITVKSTGERVPARARQMFTARRVDGRWKLLHYMFQEDPSD
jgi:uncharacterized protein (TIGR02246 family)